MSQIILKALDKDTGKAYFLKNKKLYLIAPPYQMDDWSDANKRSLTNAISKKDFRAYSESFDDIYAMIDYVEIIVAGGNPEIEAEMREGFREFIEAVLDDSNFIKEKNGLLIQKEKASYSDGNSAKADSVEVGAPEQDDKDS